VRKCDLQKTFILSPLSADAFLPSQDPKATSFGYKSRTAPTPTPVTLAMLICVTPPSDVVLEGDRNEGAIH